MGNNNALLGIISLLGSIGGILLFEAIPFLSLVFPSYTFGIGTAFGCWVISVMLELLALGCGIAARNTTTGRAGLVIICILLVLVALMRILGGAQQGSSSGFLKWGGMVPPGGWSGLSSAGLGCNCSRLIRPARTRPVM